MKCIPRLLIPAMMLGMAPSASAQIDRLLQGVAKTAQAVTLSDRQMAEYVHQSVLHMDSINPVAPANDPYSIRLAKLTQGLTSIDGMPLNFKVYKVTDVNAFACADGSVRVFAGIMDMMTDDELLGIIGHELGHVAKHHSKKQLKQALLNSAIMDGLASTSQTAAALTETQLGALAENLVNAKYSRKQETEADNFGYDFLKAHGKNPRTMASAFRKMLQLEQQGNLSGQSNQLTQMFSSHPDTRARIKNIENRAKKDKIPTLSN